MTTGLVAKSTVKAIRKGFVSPLTGDHPIRHPQYVTDTTSRRFPVTEPLLSLTISAGYPRKPPVLDRLQLEVHSGEILGLVGGSGEGKSTIAMAILRLLEFKGGCVSGNINFGGRDLTKLTHRQMRQIRGKEIGLVPQSPLSSLNSHLTLGRHLAEVWRAHEPGKPNLSGLMESVSLPADEAFLKHFPQNLSVGMAQRFLIAMAILHTPSLILADEPTSALDMISQAEVLRLFRQLNRERGIAMLYISHDLVSLASLCHRVAILYHGQIVESGTVASVFQNPQHPFTRRLIEAIPAIVY